MSKIDRSKIPTPKVTFSEMVTLQLTLMKENDFTLEGKHLRVAISGKGCDGFTYSVGFTEKVPDDFEIPNQQNLFYTLMDPFAAFYLQECFIDYIQDLDQGQEGFVIQNKMGEKYHGKFWREDESSTPPMI